MRETLSEITSYFNPIFLYYTLIYGAGKVYEVTTGSESIFQTIWDKYMDYVGDNEAVHLVLVLNIHTFAMYWILGAILFAMQKYKVPKTLENFKIQSKESEIEKGENLVQVRKFSN